MTLSSMPSWMPFKDKGDPFADKLRQWWLDVAGAHSTAVAGAGTTSHAFDSFVYFERAVASFLGMFCRASSFATDHH